MKAHIVSGTLVIIMITFTLFVAAVSSPASAEIEYGSTESNVLGNPNLVIRDTLDSDEATVATLLDTLTFDDNVNHWYIVYPDSLSAATDGVTAGDLVSVTYDGTTYNNVTVFVGNQFDGTVGLGTIIADNTTIFFKPGEYSVSAGNGAYDRFYKFNLSLIGLDGTAGSVTFDMGYIVISGSNLNTRNLTRDDLYISNITFDAKNRGMRDGSMGQHFIHLNSSSNVVFDNVVIKNISSVYGYRNVAINAINANNVVFNDVILEDWKSSSGYAPIQVNNSSRNIYFNDLTLNDVHGIQGFIKIEDGTTYTTNLALTSVFFTGTLFFQNMTESEKTIYVQSYVYETVAFPSDIYRYAQIKNQNGSSSSSYLILSTVMPNSIGQYAIFDLKDNTFVVKKGDTLTQVQQIQNIVNTIACIQKTSGMTTVEYYNVKYVVGASLGAVSLPEIKVSTTFQSGTNNYTGFWENIRLNVIPVANIVNDISVKEIFAFDQTGYGSNITLPVSNNRYELFNIDFNVIQKCTLQEVIEGITPLSSVNDPYEYLYGSSSDLTYAEYGSSRSPLILNATDETFQSCIFTSLVNKIEIDGSSSIPTWYVGDERYLTASLTDTNDNSFTHQNIIGENLNKNTANDGLPIIKWFSTDTSVATVDEDTGKVTVVGVGVTEIVAKAADEYNDGEVEKPWAVYSLVANAGTYTIDFDSNGGIAAVPTSADVTYGSAYGTMPTTSRVGYTFTGWYTAVSGGTRVEATSIVGITSDIVLYAQWTINSYTVSYVLDGGSGTPPTQSAAQYQASFTVDSAYAGTKTGYAFGGWSDGIMTYAAGSVYTMGAANVILTAVWNINSYTVTYILDGSIYTTQVYTYGQNTIPATYIPTTGYEFSGWSSVPTIMPAYDVTVSGTTSLAYYTITYYVNGSVYITQFYTYSQNTIPATYIPDMGFEFSGWSSVPTTMPAYDVTVRGMTFQIQYIISLSSSNVTVAGITDGSIVTYGPSIIFTISALYGYADPTVTCTIGGNVYHLTVMGDTYTIVGIDVTGDIIVSAIAVEKYKYTTEYDSDVFELDVGSEPKYGKSFTAELTVIGDVNSYLVVVTMGGVVIPNAFTYNQEGTGGTIYIEYANGDVDISVIDVQYDNPVSNDNSILWIGVVIIVMSSSILFLFYGRRKIIFSDDSFIIMVGEVPIESGERMHKGDIFTVKVKDGYDYTVSNATISDGIYTVDGRRGDIVVSLVEKSSK